MGSDPNETRKGKRTGGKKEQASPFVVFRPTEAQKREIAAEALTLSACVDVLIPLLEQGHKLTLGHKAENGATFLHLREGGAEFSEAVTLSCWHAEPLRVYQMMAYAVRKVYPEFPLIQLGFSNIAPDW